MREDIHANMNAQYFVLVSILEIWHILSHCSVLNWQILWTNMEHNQQIGPYFQSLVWEEKFMQKCMYSEANVYSRARVLPRCVYVQSGIY